VTFLEGVSNADLNGGISTYEIDNRQYIAVAAGNATASGAYHRRRRQSSYLDCRLNADRL
jgi:hypothetical protein